MAEKTPEQLAAEQASKAAADKKAAAEKEAADKAAADKKAEDERKAEQEAHDANVAKKQRELSDAQAAQRAATRPVVTNFAGIVRGPFVISGENLDKGGREVRIGGVLVERPVIKPNFVKGTVPADVKPGKATCQVGDVKFDGIVTK